MPSKDYTDEKKALAAKTARLRELRLAKEAEDLAALPPAAAKAPTVRKAVVRKRKPPGSA